MTYIIAGQLDNINFLMSDCIGKGEASNGKNIYLFVEKIKRLMSDSDTYFSMTGPGYLAQIVELYDYWLYSQGIKSNFLETEFLTKLMNFIGLATAHHPDKDIKLKANRFFFLSNNGVYFCNVNYDDNNVLKEFPLLHKVNNRHYIDSNIASQFNPMGTATSTLDKSNLREYCLRKLKHLASGDGESERLFPSRIQFIVLDKDGENITEPALKYSSDAVASFFSLPYQQLDSDEFKFDL